MARAEKPSLDLAKAILPHPLLRAIESIFAAYNDGVCLVGGTALSGFYAGHRRSDDIDLFTKDTFSHRATIAAVLDLKHIGLEFSSTRESPHHFHGLALLEGHRFTIDVVLDANFHKIPNAQTRIAKICVATLSGLLAMKLATLVSRCSEKDLYDLMWLFDNYRRPPFHEIVELGRIIDGGVSEESILISLSGAELRESACHFAEAQGQSSQTVFEEVTAFRHKFLREYSLYLKDKPEDHKLKAVLSKLRSKRS